jgi:hypothetical protein
MAQFYDPIARRTYSAACIRHDIALLEVQLERAAGPAARRALRQAIRERERRLETGAESAAEEGGGR